MEHAEARRVGFEMANLECSPIDLSCCYISPKLTTAVLLTDAAACHLQLQE